MLFAFAAGLRRSECETMPQAAGTLKMILNHVTGLLLLVMVVTVRTSPELMSHTQKPLHG